MDKPGLQAYGQNEHCKGEVSTRFQQGEEHEEAVTSPISFSLR